MTISDLAKRVAVGAAFVAICSAQDPEPAARVYAQASKSVFTIIVKSAAGEAIAQATGFAVDGNRIITNEHVVRGGSPYLDIGTVRIALKVLAVDSVNDLAVLGADAEISSPPLKLAASQPKPGTTVFALGNPAGLEKSISTGVVAAIRSMNGRDLVQISAPISPGSSGGPVLIPSGEVVGVAVGMLEGGQNLNFAVPANAVLHLLNGQTDKADIPSLLSRAEEASQKQRSEDYSTDADSPYQRMGAEVDRLLSQSLELAGSNPVNLAAVVDETFDIGSSIAAVKASERLVAAKPTADAYLKLATSLKRRYADEGSFDSESATLKRAEVTIRSVFKITRQPTAEMYAVLADILEDRSLTAESKTAFSKEYELATSTGAKYEIGDGLRGLIRTNRALQSFAEADRWFQTLVQSGAVAAFDWRQQADSLFTRGQYLSAGDNYIKAAQGGAYLWTNWCSAGTAYSFVSGAEDKALESARACIRDGAGKSGSDAVLSSAHNTIASILNQRGVYEEALSHAREAVGIDPNNALYQDSLADSFIGLRRFQEAINSAKQAIRLSDGKYAFMHFTLASAYFEIEDWQGARQSFQKAAELDPKNDAAAYNVALCFVRLGYYRDAATWYEEVLRRNPNHPERQDILTRIQALRK